MSQMRMTVAQGRPQWVLWSSGSCYAAFQATHVGWPTEWDPPVTALTDTTDITIGPFDQDAPLGTAAEGEGIAVFNIPVTAAVGTYVRQRLTAARACGARVTAGLAPDERIVQVYATDGSGVEQAVGEVTLSPSSPTMNMTMRFSIGLAGPGMGLFVQQWTCVNGGALSSNYTALLDDGESVLYENTMGLTFDQIEYVYVPTV